MHPIVQMQQVTRQEFLRGLEGLSDEDARKRIHPMNSISWIVGHVAHQEHTFFVAWPHGREAEPRFHDFATGRPPSQHPLEEVMDLWRAACDAADACLHTATEDDLQRSVTRQGAATESENLGTLITRNIFHYWCHIGEISAIRQMLGHSPPQFVTLHGWFYGGL